MSTVVIKTDNLDKLEQFFKDAHNKSLNVGWFEGANYDDGTPVAGVAAIQEFGSANRNIPARSFMRPTIGERAGDWSDLVSEETKSALNGDGSYDRLLNRLGLTVVGDIQKTIVSSNYPALSPITIALRRLRNDGYQIGGAMVGAVAAAIAEGRTGRGELGDQSYGNKDPLRDTGIMLATLTYEAS